MTNQDKISILLVGQNIENQIVFNNALKSLKMSHSTQYFFEMEKAMVYLSAENSSKPNLIFLEAGKKQDCINDVSGIRNASSLDSVSIAMFGNASNDMDADEAFASGVNIYIHKKYDFTGLKRILKHIIGTDCHFQSCPADRKTYMLSI